MSDYFTRVERCIVKPDGQTEKSECQVIREHPLKVFINDRPVYRLICLKESLRELVVGRLYTDGLIETDKEIYKIYFCKEEKEVSILLNRDIRWGETSDFEQTCCQGNLVLSSWDEQRSSMRELDTKADWKDEWVFKLADEFSKGMPVHMATNGTHSCFLARRGEILYKCEDIGRHNAVDKAVGYAILNSIDLSECMLFTSGRVPVDMVIKVIHSGVPVLVSKSVPTEDSVILAKKYGLRLICRAYPDCFEIY